MKIAGVERCERRDVLRDGKQLVDFCSEDKIVFRQTADGVRGQLDGESSIPGQMQIGVMVLRFGEGRDALDEPDRIQKILALDGLTKRAGLHELPAVDVFQEPLRVLRRQRGSTFLAGCAPSLREGVGTHQSD